MLEELGEGGKGQRKEEPDWLNVNPTSGLYWSDLVCVYVKHPYFEGYTRTHHSSPEILHGPTLCEGFRFF